MKLLEITKRLTHFSWIFLDLLKYQESVLHGILKDRKSQIALLSIPTVKSYIEHTMLPYDEK